jgi:CubicO group peptidase (beta-lactamase class C family)
MLLNLGMYQDRRILSEASVREMTRPQTGNMAPVGFVPGSVWGLGVGMVGQPQEITATLHEGSFGHGGAFGTQAWADPHRRAVYILLIQRMGLHNSDASPFRRSFQEAAGKVVASENDPSS